MPANARETTLSIDVQVAGMVDEVVKDPTPDEVAHAIERLDQHTHTMVAVHRADWWNLMVGGGQGQFIVTIEQQMTGERHQLIDESRRGQDGVDVVAGGQRGRYDAHLVVDRATAVQAGRTFARSGQLDPALTWTDASRRDGKGRSGGPLRSPAT